MVCRALKAGLILLALVCCLLAFAPEASALNLTGFYYGAPILLNTSGYGNRADEPLAIDLNITCFHDNRSDLRIVYNNETFLNFRRFANDTKAIIKVNASNATSNTYWLYCYNDNISDTNNESFFRVFDDFAEDPHATGYWNIRHNSSLSGYGLSHNAASKLVSMTTGLVGSGENLPVFIVYNRTGGYYNTTPTLFYSAIAYVYYENPIEGTLPHRYVGMAETTIGYPGKGGGGAPNPLTNGSIYIDCNRLIGSQFDGRNREDA